MITVAPGEQDQRVRVARATAAGRGELEELDRRSDQIAACIEDLEHEYVTAVDDDGELKFLPVVSERARAKLNQMAARKTRPPKRKTRPLAQLRKEWK